MTNEDDRLREARQAVSRLTTMTAAMVRGTGVCETGHKRGVEHYHFDTIHAHAANIARDLPAIRAALAATPTQSGAEGPAAEWPMSGRTAIYGWHGDGDLCLGPECNVVDADGDHPTADIHSNDWYDGYAAAQRERDAAALRSGAEVAAAPGLSEAIEEVERRRSGAILAGDEDGEQLLAELSMFMRGLRS